MYQVSFLYDFMETLLQRQKMHYLLLAKTIKMLAIFLTVIGSN